MARRDLTFRVFVSSTFGDLVVERNALQQTVFPSLQDYCQQHGARFQAIDLRWGVSHEAALDQQTINICRAELQRCQKLSPRPNFIVLLGDRYGWCPLPPQVETEEFELLLQQLSDGECDQLLRWYRMDNNAVPSEYCLGARDPNGEFAAHDRWEGEEKSLRAILLKAVNRVFPDRDFTSESYDPRRRKYEESATHQEIRHGVLQLEEARNHVFCYLRTIQGLPADKSAIPYRDMQPIILDGETTWVINDDARSRLEALKATLERSLPENNIYRCQARWQQGRPLLDLDSLCGRVEADLRAVIDQELALFQRETDLERERRGHRQFAEARALHFTGRQDPLKAIDKYLRNDDRRPLVIQGSSGSGKTALLASSYLDHAHRGEAVVLARFIAATPSSTDLRSLLSGVCQELRSEASIPSTMNDLVKEFSSRLARGNEQRRRLLIYLDGLDQLAATDNAQSLFWLPRKLPKGCKLIVSVLDDDGEVGNCVRNLRAILPAECFVELPALSTDEGEVLLRAWLQHANRTLQPEQLDCALSRFSGCPYPLYLKLAFEEARRWKAYDGLPTQGPGSDVPSIVNDLFASLELPHHHGAMLTSRCIGYLAAARRGLSEDELLDVLSADEDVIRDFRRRSPDSPQVNRLPVVIWSRLFADLEPYVAQYQIDGALVFSFYHRQIGEVADQRFAADAEIRHRHLAKYFRNQADPGAKATWTGSQPRALSALPYHQTKGLMWAELEATLCDLRFIEAKSVAGMTFELVDDYRVALDAHPEVQEQRQRQSARDEALARYTKDLVDWARDRGSPRGSHNTSPDLPSAVAPWE